MVTHFKFRKWTVVFVGFMALWGCSRGKLDPQKDSTADRLLRIGKAYVKSTYRLGHAPQSFEEIKDDIEGDASPDIMRSPNDGEPFAIIWGVDYTKLPPAPNDPFTIGAYEKNGKDGKRYVLRFPIGVTLLTDDELKKAVFPPGHTFP